MWSVASEDPTLGSPLVHADSGGQGEPLGFGHSPGWASGPATLPGGAGAPLLKMG